MKKAFYYLRKLTDRGIHPYACVCVAQNDERTIVSRGISVCSDKDTFSKKIARNKALGYATKALNSDGIQIEKRSSDAGQIVDNIINFGKFPAVDSISGKKKGVYLQSSTLEIPGPDCMSVPSAFLPLTAFEQKLLEDN